MAPDDVKELKDKLDDVLVQVSKLWTQVELVKLNQENHSAQHEEYLAHRHDTCPNAGAVRDTITSLNGLAGVQRKDHSAIVDLADRVEDMEKWRTTVLQAEEVADAKSEVRMTPIRWVWNNIEKIGVTVTIALLIELLQKG